MEIASGEKLNDSERQNALVAVRKGSWVTNKGNRITIVLSNDLIAKMALK